MKTRCAQRGMLFGCVLLLQLAAAPVYAVDGVIEINQARALAGNVTPGDTTPGFPVVISLPGSYRLTGNLTVADKNTTAIQVTADDVTIDLNGFSIIGPVSCTGGPPVTSCTPAGGTGVGITVTADKAGTIVNGTVQGMGAEGISLSIKPGARIDRVKLISNGGNGISARNAIITNCVVESNGDDGISFDEDSSISGNLVLGNGREGIRAGQRSTVVNNTSSFNGRDGIFTQGASTVIGNTVAANTLFGLALSTSPLIKDGYGSNVITSNTAGTVFGGVQIGTNICNGALCP